MSTRTDLLTIALNARSSLISQFARFCIVGGVGFVVDAGMLTLLTNGLGWHPYAARAVSFAIAVTTTWYCNRRWVFRPTRKARTEYGSYVSVQLSGAAVNLAVFVGLIEALPPLGRIPVLPLAAGSALAMLVNFSCSRKFVFHEQHGADREAGRRTCDTP